MTDSHVTQRQALDALNYWLAAKRVVKQYQDLVDQHAATLRAYFDESGERELIDGETKQGARLRPNRGTPSYDVVNLREQDPQLFERLFALGAVQVNHKIVTAQEQAGQLAGMERWRMPGGLTDSLIEVGGKSSN